MTSIPIPFTGATLDLYPPAVGPTWLGFSLATVLVPAVGLFLAWLYRREAGLVPRRVAVALLALRAAAVGVVLLTLVLDPVVGRIDREEVPGQVLVAVDRSDSMRVTDPHRPLADKLRLARALRLAGDTFSDSELAELIDQAEKSGEAGLPLPDTAAGRRQRERLARVLDRLDALTRHGIAVRTVGPDGVDLIGELKAKHAVEVAEFDQAFVPLPADAGLKAVVAPDRGLPADGSPPRPAFTDLKLPLLHASQMDGGGTGTRLLGVVVLTDGRHNWGESPVGLAEQLGRRKVPVYPVLLAPNAPPPDVAAVAARPQAATVFKGSVVPVEVEVRVTGRPAGDVKVSLESSGPPVTETIPHAGKDAVYRLVLKTRLDSPGPQALTVTAEAAGPPDRFPGNNKRSARVNVVKDRARLLLIDGEARWEFHYLHTALGRDENMDVRSVVFRQPRVTRAADEEVRPLGLPAQKLPDDPDLSEYDCVVLGDAEPGQLPPEYRARLERYVADTGGTLVMVAGKRALPLDYPDDDPLRKLLPVRRPQAFDEPGGFRLAPTAEADRNWFVQLADTTGASREVWGRFPPHFWAVVGEAKDGAEVLAALPGRSPREAAVIARQNYGFGRVLYVGIDSTWRWRFKAGDYFHHRFWGQVAQWAASDRLLPTANAAGTIRFGPREPTYRPGQGVEVVVRATEAVKKLGPNALKGVRVVRLTDDGPESPVGLSPLTSLEGRPRELTTALTDLNPGKYAVELDIPEWADQLQGPPGPDGRASKLRARFEVLSPDGEELVELSGNRDLLEQIAAASGGKVYTPDAARELVGVLAQRVATREERVERPARRSWWVLGLFAALITAEWLLRKWSGLP